MDDAGDIANVSKGGDDEAMDDAGGEGGEQSTMSEKARAGLLKLNFPVPPKKSSKGGGSSGTRMSTRSRKEEEKCTDKSSERKEGGKSGGKKGGKSSEGKKAGSSGGSMSTRSKTSSKSGKGAGKGKATVSTSHDASPVEPKRKQGRPKLAEEYKKQYVKYNGKCN